MFQRLVVRLEGSPSRHLLAEGDNRVGSDEGCEVPIRHPTVSRRHAVIRVRGQDIEVEDLGSRNGTLVEGRRLLGKRALGVGQSLRFGGVDATLEGVSADDLQAGLTFVAGSEAPHAPQPDGRPTTVPLEPLQAFALEVLPRLLGQLAEATGPLRMAQAVGSALFEALPCVSVEVLSAGRGDAGILFAARREEAPPAVAESSSDGGPVSIRVAFAHATHARAYAPLLRSAALLVELAQGPGAISPPPATPPPARPTPPEPASLCPRVRALYADAGRVAAGDVSVLILGESGTGKELLARYVHACSPRAERPFVALNCAALPGDLLEAELFGIEQGVATGVDPRPGKFELADGGTLFLDEIGDMARETQAKILRVLQEGEVYRLGARRARSARVRVLAATNRELRSLVEGGALRADLYHRIADWAVELPPLRARRMDIPNLAAHFLTREAERRGQRIRGISRRALDVLLGHAWPGNIRQLEREMARAALFLEDGQLLESAHLSVAATAGRPPSLKRTLEDVERSEIQAALSAHGSDVASAARELGLGRSTLYRRMRALGLQPAAPD